MGASNTSVELTATSHTLRQKVSGDSITPSHWLRSHPVRRRYTPESAAVFSQAAVAHLFR